MSKFSYNAQNIFKNMCQDVTHPDVMIHYKQSFETILLLLEKNCLNL